MFDFDTQLHNRLAALKIEELRAEADLRRLVQRARREAREERAALLARLRLGRTENEPESVRA